MNDIKPVIAIIGGTGSLGTGLARRWSAAEYTVIIGSRNSAGAEAAAVSLAIVMQDRKLEYIPAKAMENLAAAQAADIVVLTVPYSHHASTLQTIRPALADKILIDTTVPLVPPKVARVQLPAAGSAAVEAQELLGDAVRVVSAFQNVAAHHVQEESSPDCDILVCGNNRNAREQVVDLVEAAGMRAWHAGSIANSAAAESLTSVLIFINRANSCHAGIRISGVPDSE
jgi:NADPH-dependent F420 reductase